MAYMKYKVYMTERASPNQATTKTHSLHSRVKNEISLYLVSACSNFQVMRIKEVITKDKMS